MSAALADVGSGGRCGDPRKLAVLCVEASVHGDGSRFCGDPLWTMGEPMCDGQIHGDGS